MAESFLLGYQPRRLVITTRILAGQAEIDPLSDSVQRIWRSIGVDMYLPCDRLSDAREPVPDHVWSAGERLFAEVVRRMEVECLIVLSRRLWNRMPTGSGDDLDDGLLIDPDGRPTRDPAVMFHGPTGAILPFGGHKGYGLALACEILAGTLAAGLPALPENLRPGRVVNNALCFTLDPGRVAAPGWDALTDAVLDYIEGTPPAPGTDRVRVPGAPEREHLAVAADRGITLDPDTVAALHCIGENLGLDVPALLGA